MKRTRPNFVIDALEFTGYVPLTTTGVLLCHVLPPGSGHPPAIRGLVSQANNVLCYHYCLYCQGMHGALTCPQWPGRRPIGPESRGKTCTIPISSHGTCP